MRSSCSRSDMTGWSPYNKGPFGHLIFWPPYVKSWLIRKDLDAGKDWRRRGHQRTRWLDGTTDSVDMILSKLRGIAEDRAGWCAPVRGITESATAEHRTCTRGNTTCSLVFSEAPRGFSLSTLGGAWPCWHLDSRLPASRTVKYSISIV